MSKVKSCVDPKLRQGVINALEIKLPPKIAKNYEKAIHKMCIASEESEDLNTVYAQYAYEKVGELLACECREDREKVLKDIKERVTGFDSMSYSEIKDNALINARVLTEGMKVKKGEIPCKKCKSTETYYYSAQTRTADEGQSVFVICTSCGTKGRIQ